jgi:hypothetical protein
VSIAYLDPNLTNNSAMACFLLTDFCQKYEAIASAPVPLTKLMLVLPLLWHHGSCHEIARRQSTTNLTTVLQTEPALRINFDRRLQAFAPVALQGLNLACASHLLDRSMHEHDIYLQCAFKRWPMGAKPANVPGQMLSALQRLAHWFAADTAQTLYVYFLGSEHAIRN